jgi:hypothetical protein
VAKRFRTAFVTPDEALQKKNLRHQHFIDTLRKILLILEPHVSPNAKTMDPPNGYELLEPKEVLAVEDGILPRSTDLTASDDSQANDAEAAAQLQTQRAQHLFHVECILMDFDGICQYKRRRAMLLLRL